MLAVANVYFRDTQHFVAILLQIWFYADADRVPGLATSQEHRTSGADGQGHPAASRSSSSIPMEHFVAVFRDLLYDNRLALA